MEKRDKLQVKDFITVGIFTTIYFIVFMVIQMFMGGIPIVFLLMPLPTALIGGIIYMLYLAKVPKRGAILLMSTILALLLGMMLGVWTGFVIPIVCGLLAELVTGIGKYRSFKWNLLGYSIFSCWMICGYLPYWLMRDLWFEKTAAYYEGAYVEALKALTPLWVLFAMILAIMVVAFFGTLLGKKILKKHFVKAGIV